MTETVREKERLNGYRDGTVVDCQTSENKPSSRGVVNCSQGASEKTRKGSGYKERCDFGFINSKTSWFFGTLMLKLPKCVCPPLRPKDPWSGWIVLLRYKKRDIALPTTTTKRCFVSPCKKHTRTLSTFFHTSTCR